MMSEQDKRENVINALELCTSEIETRTQVPCEKCHYHNKNYHGVHGNGCCNMRSLQRDILALLKAQEPRVMTWDEVCAWWDIPVWERDPVFHEHINKRGSVCEWTNLRPCEEELYGVTDRCWTSRPDDERRQNTPWNT